MKRGKWIKKWTVAGETQDRIVSLAESGEYGCSCPRWIFRREQCHHIQYVRDHPEFAANAPPILPECVLIGSGQPQRQGDRLLIPLVIPGNTHQEATICAFLLDQGYSMKAVRETRGHVPRKWTAAAIKAYVADRGPAEFPSYPIAS